MERRNLFISLYLVVSIITIVVLGYFKIANQKKYVYVNVDYIISEIAKDLREKNTDIKVVETKLTQASKAFSKELADYSEENNAVIFTSNKPLAGAEEETGYFLVRLKETMQ